MLIFEYVVPALIMLAGALVVVLAPPFSMFHLIRAMHMASRCVACCQCELVCPAHIPLILLYDLMRWDVGDLFGYVPGADITAAPPLSPTLEEALLRNSLVVAIVLR